MEFVLGAVTYLAWSIGLYRAIAKGTNSIATTTNQTLRHELKLLQRAVVADEET